MGSGEKCTLLERALRSRGEEGLSAWHRSEGLQKALLDGRRHGWIEGGGMDRGWKGGRKAGWIIGEQDRSTEEEGSKNKIDHKGPVLGSGNISKKDQET